MRNEHDIMNLYYMIVEMDINDSCLILMDVTLIFCSIIIKIFTKFDVPTVLAAV